jgi:hypothetical protein
MVTSVTGGFANAGDLTVRVHVGVPVSGVVGR